MRTDLPGVVDLFCGAGGFSLGFQATGFEILAAVDSDATAGRTFRRNFSQLQPESPPLVLAGKEHDLAELDPSAISCRRPDVLIGGPPCQAFSNLGRGKLNHLHGQGTRETGFRDDPRNRLFNRFLAAVEHWQPQAVVMENVPGMTSVEGVDHTVQVTHALAELGYRTGFVFLNAVWYGVPQFRERVFFVGLNSRLGVRPRTPPVTHLTQLPEGYRAPYLTWQTFLQFDDLLVEGELPVSLSRDPRPAVTVGEALDDLPRIEDHLQPGQRPRGDFRRVLEYSAQPHSEYARLMRSWPGFPVPTTIDDHAVRRTPRDYSIFQRMQPGDRYPEALVIARQLFDAELQRLREAGGVPAEGTDGWESLRAEFIPPYKETGFPDRWRKLVAGQPSWTVPAHLSKDSYSHIHHDSSQARMISIREAARLQSFPDAFRFEGNMGDCFRQIGNAVPPLLAWAVARPLLELLSR